MLPFDQRPWAKTAARCVIAFTLLGIAAYVFWVKQERSLDWGERAIVVLLLLTVIPPNVAVIRRHTAVSGPAGSPVQLPNRL